MLTLSLRGRRPYRSVASVGGDAVMLIAANAARCSSVRLFVAPRTKLSFIPQPTRRTGFAGRVSKTLLLVPFAASGRCINALHLLGIFAKVTRISLYLLHHSSPVGCLTRRCSGRAQKPRPLAELMRYASPIQRAAIAASIVAAILPGMPISLCSCTFQLGKGFSMD